LFSKLLKIFHRKSSKRYLESEQNHSHFSPILVAILFVFFGCATLQEAVPPKFTSPTIAQDQPDKDQKAKGDQAVEIEVQLVKLKEQLMLNGVSEEWITENFHDETFKLDPHIGQYFQQSAEKLTDNDKKHDLSWYLSHLNADAKIEEGKKFIEQHWDIFQKAEAKNGIHKELIAAIIGMETNYADHFQRGNFYALNSLVSQYIFTNRKKFALRELTALYQFSKQTGRPLRYFTSSYAGAVGWGQFLPSSLLAFFIDANGITHDIDPFSIDDTIFSVENYLYKNNLSGENIHNDNSKYQAIFAYNHSDAYVKAVLYIYEGLRNHFDLQKTSSYSQRKDADF